MRVWLSEMPPPKYPESFGCDIKPEYRNNCPVLLPCPEHNAPVSSYMEHLEVFDPFMVKRNRPYLHRYPPATAPKPGSLPPTITCPKLNLWKTPWENVIAKKKIYHGIRISGKNKRARIFEQFAPVVCENWDRVTELCLSAREFERDISLLGR